MNITYNNSREVSISLVTDSREGEVPASNDVLLFEHKHGLTLLVAPIGAYRENNGYRAVFCDCEIREPYRWGLIYNKKAGLHCAFGDTVLEAINNYLKLITGEVLLVKKQDEKTWEPLPVQELEVPLFLQYQPIDAA